MSGWKSDLEFRFQTAVCAWSPLRGKEQDEQDHRAPTEKVPLSRKERNSHLPEEGGGCVQDRMFWEKQTGPLPLS